MPFKLPDSGVAGTALVTFDPDGTTWVKSISVKGSPYGNGNFVGHSFFLCSESLGVWEGASAQMPTDREKGYVFTKGAISQAMKTAPDLFAVRLYEWRDLGS